MNCFFWSFSRKYSKLTLDLILSLPKILTNIYKLFFDFFLKNLCISTLNYKGDKLLWRDANKYK